jgi:signal transduction histidine kinase
MVLSNVVPTGDAEMPDTSGPDKRAESVLAWSLCAGSVLLVALALVFDLMTPDVIYFHPEERPAPLFGYLMKVLTPTYSAVGALIASRLPRNPTGWLFCCLGLINAASVCAQDYADYALLVSFELPYGEVAAWLSGLLGWAPAFLVGTLLLLLFPSGRLPSRAWLAVVWASVLGAVAETVGGALYPGNMVGHHHYVVNPFGVVGVVGPGLTTYDLFATAKVGGKSLLLVCTLAALLSLFLRLRRASATERQQLKWFLYAAVPAALSICVLMLQLIVLDSDHLYLSNTTEIMSWGVFAAARYVGAASSLMLPAFTLIAILRYRLYDIDIVINRTLVYTALTACVVTIYVLVVGGLGTLLQAQGNFGVALLATGLVALLFQPLRARLQLGVNRLMYGERDDPYAVISRLGRRLEATITPDAVLPTVVDTIAQALKLPYAAVLLREDDALRTAASYGSPKGDTLELPLVYGGEEIGRLVLAPRTPGEQFSAADLRLLEDLARNAEVAAHAVRLTADLQRSRERLISAREEERRRLRRDLHDGLGPTLASLALKLDAARKLVRRSPDDAERLLQQLQDQTQDSVGEVRRLVYGLRPPALDDLGLVAAVRQQAEVHGFLPSDRAEEASEVEGPVVFTLEANSELPPLPAAVEVAAFRIAQEALTNVARHAGAGTCRVRLHLRQVEGVLELEVADDGKGMPPGRTAGVGLASMRERAEELGGTCRVEPAASGGTRVLARLPVPREEDHQGAARPWIASSASS